MIKEKPTCNNVESNEDFTAKVLSKLGNIKENLSNYDISIKGWVHNWDILISKSSSNTFTSLLQRKVILEHWKLSWEQDDEALNIQLFIQDEI